MDVESYPKNRKVFLLYQHIIFHKPIKIFMKRATSFEDLPLSFNFVTDVVGKSSSWFYVTAKDTESLLMTSAALSVFVDINSRTKQNYPKKFQEFVNKRSEKLIEKNHMKRVLEDFDLGKEKFYLEKKMNFLDIDFNNHVNNSVYVTSCIESLEIALKSGFACSIPKQAFRSYFVDEIKLKVVHEVLHKSVLQIIGWQHSNRNFRFHLTVDDELVAFCCLSFSQLSSSL